MMRKTFTLRKLNKAMGKAMIESLSLILKAVALFSLIIGLTAITVLIVALTICAIKYFWSDIKCQDRFSK